MPTYIPLIPIPIQLQDLTSSVNLSGGTLEFYLAGTATPTNLYSNASGTSIGTSITLNAGGMPEAGGNVITLFRDAAVNLKIVGKNAAGVEIFTSDGINAITAGAIQLADAGSDFTATDLEGGLLEVKGQYKRKGSNTSIASSTTVVDDAALAGFTITAGARYKFEAFIRYTQNVGNLKFSFQFSETPDSFNYTYNAISESADAVHGFGEDGTTETITTMTDTDDVGLHMIGEITADATLDGTMDLQWAQETSSANNTTLYAGSWMQLTRI